MTVINQHINNLPSAAGKFPARSQNAIIRSFVASKKKYLIFKRFFDIVFAILVIVLVLSWLLPLAALLIKLDSKGPVFFKQTRIGKGGKHFLCIKLRTMKGNDEADELQAQDKDDRITRAGRFLRKTNIDELPQFFNVLLGHMSVVGPRPHMVADCIRFSFVISSYHFRNLVRPGITGLAQINGYHGATPDYESIIVRYYWDAQYVRKARFLLDMKIISVTLVQRFRNFAGICFNLGRNKSKDTVVTKIRITNKEQGISLPAGKAGNGEVGTL